MKYFPLFMDFTNTACLVIGGGDIALNKTLTLLEASAKVCVVAPQVKSEFSTLFNEGKITLYQQDYSEQQLTGYFLVIAATDEQQINQQIYQDCQQRNIPVNVVDNGELSQFIFPAIIERSPITIALSTDGSSPVLSRILRGKLESLIPFHYGNLATLAKKYREKVKSTFQSVNQRRRFWESVFQGKIADKVFDGKLSEAENLLQNLIAQNQLSQAQKTTGKQQNNPCTDEGEVYLVGAGPGDPELLTFKALRLMQQADVVFYDRLVSSEIQALVRRDAEMIYVGKQCNNHAMSQQQINDQLVEHAKKGRRVLRLKGGDPFIFGRGGEEAEELIKNQVPFQVVPGITSAAGASTYCGIPLTHRDYAQSVTFVTGHLKNGSHQLDWNRLAQKQQTLVIYMGLNSLSGICTNLVENGLPQTTAIAVIQNATRTNQQILTGTLNTIEQKLTLTSIQSPALIIVGEVVKLHKKLTR